MRSPGIQACTHGPPPRHPNTSLSLSLSLSLSRTPLSSRHPDRYKKNLKNLYVVHPTFFHKLLMSFAEWFIRCGPLPPCPCSSCPC